MADVNNLRYFSKPKGILRVVETVTAIIAFGTMASENSNPFKYSDWSEFSFLVAANVIAFVFAFIFCVCYIFRKQVETSFFFFPILEWTLDGITCLLVFLASVMGAVRCESIGGTKCSDFPTSDKNNVTAAIVFSFFTFFLLLALNVFDFFEHRDGEKSEKAAASSSNTTKA